MKKAAVPSILVAVVLLALGATAEAQQAGKIFRICVETNLGHWKGGRHVERRSQDMESDESIEIILTSIFVLTCPLTAAGAETGGKPEKVTLRSPMCHLVLHSPHFLSRPKPASLLNSVSKPKCRSSESR